MLHVDILLAETYGQRRCVSALWCYTYGETVVFMATATVAEIESGSTFRENCLATDVHKFELKVSTCNCGFTVV